MQTCKLNCFFCILQNYQQKLSDLSRQPYSRLGVASKKMYTGRLANSKILYNRYHIMKFGMLTQEEIF